MLEDTFEILTLKEYRKLLAIDTETFNLDKLDI
jgi:hypothetical protein